MTVWDTIWQSAVGAAVTGLLGIMATWLAHRRGWLAKPAAAVAGWLRSEGGTVSSDVVKLIADEVERRAETARPQPAPPTRPQPGVDGPPIPPEKT